MKTKGLLLSCAIALCSLSLPALTLPQHPATAPALVAAAESASAFRVGPLTLGMSPEQVVEALGKPTTETKAELEQATGEMVKEWEYPEHGVRLVMSTAEEGQAYALRTVLLHSPCDWLAMDKVKVGMAREEAEAGLKGLVGPGVTVYEAFNEDGCSILFEDAYQILSLQIEEGKVMQVYLGPGPE